MNALYLDDDVVVLKSFSELMRERMVLGEENYDALANSVILANKDSWFLQKWFLEYRYFNDAVSKSESLANNYHLFQLFSTFRNLLNLFFTDLVTPLLFRTMGLVATISTDNPRRQRKHASTELGGNLHSLQESLRLLEQLRDTLVR